MKALRWNTDRKRALWADDPAPTLTGPAEALVRPLAVACCDLDVAVVRERAPLSGDWAVGHECVAEVIEVGDAVATVEPGDRVVVPFQLSCGQCPTCRRGQTGSCTSVPPRAMYGLAPVAGLDAGGVLADRVRVPFADAMLVRLPAGIDPTAAASVGDNVVDGWRTIGPYADDLGVLDPADRRVLVLGGLSIGLYATAVALALEAAVDYVDTDPDRLAVAAALGANPLQRPADGKGLGPAYPVVVTTAPTVNSLHTALRSTWPGGVCTDTGLFWDNLTALPLFELYGTGIRFVTGRVMARAAMPYVLELIEAGRLDPAPVTSSTVPWDDADAAWPEMTGKTVFTRA
jgi:threonine dehydrogenase-like Zn-dependent dehydrogenase